VTTRATVLVANAHAGSEDREQVAAARRVLATQGPVAAFETGDPGDLDEVIAELDERRLVICGGDGSLHVAVAALQRAGRLDDVPIGLIPL
jgi:diacylglycerol kinase family enzyme